MGEPNFLGKQRYSTQVNQPTELVQNTIRRGLSVLHYRPLEHFSAGIPELHHSDNDFCYLEEEGRLTTT